MGYFTVRLPALNTLPLDKSRADGAFEPTVACGASHWYAVDRVLTRGAFTTREAAEHWARTRLGRSPYSIVEVV